MFRVIASLFFIIIAFVFIGLVAYVVALSGSAVTAAANIFVIIILIIGGLILFSPRC